MKVCFLTFGCRLNRAEALDEEARYLAAGWQLTENHAEANRFVVRGCSVTSRAQSDCEKLVSHLKRKYPNTRLIVQGCINRDSGSSLLPNRLRQTNRADEVALPPGTVVPVPTRTARAFLKVQDGCSGKCTFCIVPKFRGTSVSVDFDEVMDKARRFIEAGYGEIVVTGCNLTLYASRGKRLPELVSSLASLGGDGAARCRIRLGSVEPGACALEVVHAMAENRNVCRYLHLPIQSGADRILLAMRRPYMTKDVSAVVDAATALMPNLGIGCDVMCGFPGETDLDHLATKGLLTRLPFTHAHVFPYSERPGTPAPTLGARIPHSVRSERAREITQLIKTKAELFAQKFIGQTVDVIIENEETQSGRTSEYLMFKLGKDILSRDKAPRKSLATFRITSVSNGILMGCRVIASGS